MSFPAKNWWKILLWVVGFGLFAAAGHYAGVTIPFPWAPPAWEERLDGDAGERHFGWVSDPKAVEAVAGELPFRAFADTPAGKADDPLPDRVYLWEIYRKADPRGPPIRNQGQVGSCVGFGTTGAVVVSQGVAIALGAKFEIKDFSDEVTYAGSRVQVGGGRINGDGSVGAWAAKFVHEWGMVSKEVHGSIDLTQYSEARCRAWGRSGVPKELQELAREHPVQDIVLVKSWDEFKKAIASGYALAVCSNQGFAMQRDARGVARPSGSWAHCMRFDGYHAEGGAEYAHVTNSWGATAHTGPVGWGNPGTDGFWCEKAVAVRMIAAGDTWAFSNVKGFPSRRKELDWFVRRMQPRPIEPPSLFALHMRFRHAIHSN